ncbi:MAG: DUF6017 domain-containing protein [Blautia faecis]
MLSPNPSPYEGKAARRRNGKERKRQTHTVCMRKSSRTISSMSILSQHTNIDRDRLDEIVSLILETVCTKRKTIRIAGDDYPAELVKVKVYEAEQQPH